MGWQHHLNFLPLPHGHGAYKSRGMALLSEKPSPQAGLRACGGKSVHLRTVQDSGSSGVRLQRPATPCNCPHTICERCTVHDRRKQESDMRTLMAVVTLGVFTV